jgi:hypothetical protein
MRFRIREGIMKTIIMAGLLIGVMTGGAVPGKRPNAPVPDIESEVMRLLDDYMSAWNRKDLVAWERTFHFPHYRLAGGKMTVLDRPGLQDAVRVWASAGSDWHHSRWDRRRIIHSSPDKVHVDTKFTRCRADGSVIGSFESLYILTKEDGRWGVKMRSSFAP